MHEEVPGIELHCLLEVLRMRYGIDLRGYRGASLRRRAEAFVARSGLPNMAALQHQVLHEPSAVGALIDALTVQVSEMFRDPACFRAVREDVFPHLATYPEIRIWHAGCSSGEEVYSMAIMLEEEGLYGRSQIFATDISRDALAQARAGAYPSGRASLYSTNYEQAGGKHLFREYVTEAYSRIAINRRLKRNINFFEHNLVDDPCFGDVQLVVCRNTMIYFNPPTRTRALSTLRDALPHGGFLVLGSAEQAEVAEGFVPYRAPERIFRAG